MSLCIYATEGKVTARRIAMRCPATPGSWGAHSHRSDPPVSHKEMLPSCRKFAFGDLWGWYLPQDGQQDLGLGFLFRKRQLQRTEVQQQTAPQSLTAGVTGYFEKHRNCKEQVRAVQHSVLGVFPHLHYKGVRGPQSGKS